MTAYSSQVSHNPTQGSVQATAPIPSSYPPSDYSNNNGEIMAQPTVPFKANQVSNPNRNAGMSLPTASAPVPSHIMRPSVQPMPAALPPPNLKTQSQYNPSLQQIMHKPSMQNVSNMTMPKLNSNSSPVHAPSTSSSAPTSMQPVPLPTSGSTTLNVSGPGTIPNNTGTKSKSSKKSKSKNSSNPISTQSNSSNVGAHGENTGRWTQEEHRLFLEGLEKHGKGWKKIASLIKSRTVVQIRTHAQKYFQKLAKARHNGEEGDVSMEGRGGVGMHCAGSSGPGGSLTGGMSIPPLSSEQMKRRRNSANGAGGTKRKSIESVVTSAQREGKRLKEVNDPLVMPSISPCLAPFVMHPSASGIRGNQQMQNNVSSDSNPPPGPSLEESLYRFLTPMTADYSIQPPSNTASHSVNMQSQPNGVTNQSNPNQFIILPNNTEKMQFSEGSPTGVGDIPNFPSFPSSKLAPTPEPPNWYARGADVDELLHDADALNWLADTGDLDEVYCNNVPLNSDQCTPNPIRFSSSEVVSLSESESGGTTSTINVGNGTKNVAEQSTQYLATDALPPVVSSMSSDDIHALPNLFDSGSKSRTKLSTPNLFSSGGVSHSSTGNLVDENFSVFDSAMDEQAFVSALLENNENATLSVSNNI